MTNPTGKPKVMSPDLQEKVGHLVFALSNLANALDVVGDATEMYKAVDDDLRALRNAFGEFRTIEIIEIPNAPLVLRSSVAQELAADLIAALEFQDAPRVAAGIQKATELAESILTSDAASRGFAALDVLLASRDLYHYSNDPSMENGYEAAKSLASVASLFVNGTAPYIAAFSLGELAGTAALALLRDETGLDLPDWIAEKGVAFDRFAKDLFTSDSTNEAALLFSAHNAHSFWADVQRRVQADTHTQPTSFDMEADVAQEANLINAERDATLAEFDMRQDVPEQTSAGSTSVEGDREGATQSEGVSSGQGADASEEAEPTGAERVASATGSDMRHATTQGTVQGEGGLDPSSDDFSNDMSQAPLMASPSDAVLSDAGLSTQADALGLDASAHSSVADAPSPSSSTAPDSALATEMPEQGTHVFVDEADLQAREDAKAQETSQPEIHQDAASLQSGLIWEDVPLEPPAAPERSSGSEHSFFDMEADAAAREIDSSKESHAPNSGPSAAHDTDMLLVQDEKQQDAVRDELQSILVEEQQLSDVAEEHRNPKQDVENGDHW